MSKTPDVQEKTKKPKKYNVGRFFLRFIVFLVISLILGTTFYKWNAKTLMKDGLPMPFGITTAVVMSGSMSPTMEVNDLIIIVKSDSYKEGDIITFRDKDSASGMAHVTHRIIKVVDDKTVITQGDANESPDGELPISEIKGKVIMHIPGVGKALEIIKSPAVIIAVIVVAIILLARSYRNEKKDGTDELDEIKKEIERLKAEKELLENSAEDTAEGETPPEENKEE